MDASPPKAPIRRHPDAVTKRILDAAEREFMAEGYEVASTNRIVTAFGGSKATLFRYFSTKQALLGAVIQRIASRWQDRVDWHAIEDDAPRVWLVAFFVQILEWILGDDALFVGRLGIAEGHKLPELRGVFHETAGVPLQTALADQLLKWSGQGQLAVADPPADAQHLFDLVVAGAVSRALYGADRLSGAALDAHVRSCVALYLDGRLIQSEP